jgi:hypothetical protein
MSSHFDDDIDPIECHSYTHARKFELVIGNLQGFRLPVPWTPVQMGLTIATFIAIMQVRGLWAHFGPIGNFLIGAGVPYLTGRLARRSRIEGRALHRTLVGWLSTLANRNIAIRHGVRVRPARPERINDHIPCISTVKGQK